MKDDRLNIVSGLCQWQSFQLYLRMISKVRINKQMKEKGLLWTCYSWSVLWLKVFFPDLVTRRKKRNCELKTREFLLIFVDINKFFYITIQSLSGKREFRNWIWDKDKEYLIWISDQVNETQGPEGIWSYCFIKWDIIYMRKIH